MSSVETNAQYTSKGTALTGTSDTTCYTCPSGFKAEITEIRVAHSSGTAGVASVKWVDASTSATFVLCSGATVPANGALVVSPTPLHLGSGDSIAVAGANGQHVIVSGLEERIRAVT